LSYIVKEIFYTLQGEGARTGRAAVFCRFAGCNLWSGREADRSHAICAFCDTDFVGSDGVQGGKYSLQVLVDTIVATWQAIDSQGKPYVVFTGGEPLLQLDPQLIDALHQVHFEIAIETNGTLPVPPNVDWICVSPKANAPLVVRQGHELKLIFPQLAAMPEQFTTLAFTHFFLQPLDSFAREQHTKQAIAYCLAHPQWRLSLQTHKLLGIP
jgi:7-carboxy-7-deazaguanine synthase (Cx14CxxC type)